MGTAEWIALGLLSFLALIGWLHSRGTSQDQEKVPERQAVNAD
jgi:hypothetical protein